MQEDGASHSWQAMLAHFVGDWQLHYDTLQAKQDGMHGFVQAFLCSFYRFASREAVGSPARSEAGTEVSEPVPGSLEEMLAFMEQVLREELQPHGLGTARHRHFRYRSLLRQRPA